MHACGQGRWVAGLGEVQAVGQGGPAHGQDPARHVRVAADELGDGRHADVRPQVQRPLEHRRQDAAPPPPFTAAYFARSLLPCVFIQLHENALVNIGMKLS